MTDNNYIASESLEKPILNTLSDMSRFGVAWSHLKSSDLSPKTASVVLLSEELATDRPFQVLSYLGRHATCMWTQITPACKGWLTNVLSIFSASSNQCCNSFSVNKNGLWLIPWHFPCLFKAKVWPVTTPLVVLMQLKNAFYDSNFFYDRALISQFFTKPKKVLRSSYRATLKFQKVIPLPQFFCKTCQKVAF